MTFFSTYDGLRQDKHHFTWKVAFIDIFSDTFPLMEPLWDEPLVLSVASTFEPKIDVEAFATQGEFIERQALQGSSDSSYGGFGRAISLSGSSLLIGAPFSGGNPRTTWDFETEDLTGWKSTGSIASKQAMFGGDSKVPNLQGRYLIATNDDQVGSLTSDPFSILGDEFSPYWRRMRPSWDLCGAYRRLLPGFKSYWLLSRGDGSRSVGCHRLQRPSRTT